MKKKVLLSGLAVFCLATATTLFSLSGALQAQTIKGSSPTYPKYKSIDANGYFYCHCMTVGKKCGCILSPPPEN